MPDYSSLYQSARSTFNVDPLLTQAVAQVESNENPNAVSRDAQGNPIAHGLLQVTASNLQRLNIPNPYVPEFNIPAGTRVLDEALTAANGNVPMALRIYQGGPDQKNWVRSMPRIQGRSGLRIRS
jgi:soluble lytic murein transglycosylase-like protein